ncbi:MAG TPA: sigma-70 family RNA polymerase sigma factor [Longimicrobium sp.]|jgi:RNA polymerase sigma-70 factor (ECF subfamily)|uniref:RNA polymerase sigma factor n=1 Tax=Longimicrobium sp. TaxID=2029185 RepID=UPI002EDA0DDC
MLRLSPSVPAEDELVRDVRGGSLNALGTLYQRHSPAVFGAAYRILGTRPDAEDVVQDVFVGLPRALAGYQERGRLEAWLRRVAVRTALMRLRGRARRREDAFDDLPELASPDGESALDRLALQRRLRLLPEKLRIVLVLKEIEGYSHDEIGALLGVSAGTSAVRLFRAWKHLRSGAAS